MGIVSTGRIFGHTPMHNTYYMSFLPRKCLFGVTKMKFVIWPRLLPKTYKFGP